MLLVSVLVVWLTVFIVPFAVYSGFSAIAGLKPPSEVSPLRFLAGIAVSKLGVAIAFVGLFYAASAAVQMDWRAYALFWWLMFVLGEIGQAIGPGYSWQEAIAGMISETVYVPLSAFAVAALMPGAMS